MNSKKLLCTFCHQTDVDFFIDTLNKLFELSHVFLYNDSDNQQKWYLMYSIELERNQILKNTISVHRKSESNTFFTVNALNTIIANANNGKLDSSFPVEWSNYRNCLILNTSEEVSIVNLAFEGKVIF